MSVRGESGCESPVAESDSRLPVLQEASRGALEEVVALDQDVGRGEQEEEKEDGDYEYKSSENDSEKPVPVP